jgi:hypothetical protein
VLRVEKESMMNYESKMTKDEAVAILRQIFPGGSVAHVETNLARRGISYYKWIVATPPGFDGAPIFNASKLVATAIGVEFHAKWRAIPASQSWILIQQRDALSRVLGVEVRGDAM